MNSLSYGTEAEDQFQEYKYSHIKKTAPDFYASFIKLNKYQKQAVLNEDRVLLLNAGVGSGKTTVLVHKVMYLYLVKNIPLSQMIVLTFTNKAAAEIKERVLQAAGQSIDAKELKYFGTFHSVARTLLSTVLPVEDLGYTKDFSVLDESSSMEMYESIIENRGLNIKYKNRLSRRLDELKSGKKLYGSMKHIDEIDELSSIIIDEKVKRNLMDFDDLIECCSTLLRRSDFTASYVIIDEFQDTDSTQLDMVDGLVGQNTRVFAVGDPNQIIYSWRGSIGDIFDIFKERYDASEATLPVNYRSTATILMAAKSFLNNPASIEAMRDKGTPIIIKRHYNSFNEAMYLADTIRKLNASGIPYREIAVFYRKQKHSRVFEDVFTHENIPYEVSLRKDLKDIPALYWFVRLIKASLNPMDREGLLFVLSSKKYGVNKSSKQISKMVSAYIECNGSSCELLKRMAGFKEWCGTVDCADGLNEKIYSYFDLDNYLSPTSISYEEEKGYIYKYIDELEKYIRINNSGILDGVKDAVENSVLYGRQVIEQIIDPESDTVKLMTLHASKGLEFKYVFISGANFGVIPMGSKIDDEEEKRLFFVGITRAKDYLEISYHSNPEDYGALPNPSPYLSMIPDELIESDVIKSRAHKLSELRREIKNNMEEKHQEAPTKKKVNHPKYGDGYVKSETDDMITAEFDGYGEKSFAKMFCPLKYIE